MIVPDVNVLINAFHTEAPRHDEARIWLTNALEGRESLGLLDVVVTGFIRIMTHPRVLKKPLTSNEAVEAINTVMQSPNTVLIHGSGLSWQIFSELVSLHKLSAADIPDAWIAATVIAEEAILVSDDRGFARFRDLNWRTVESGG